MKRLIAIAAALSLSVFASTASMAGGYSEAKPNIVEVADKAGSFKTLITALNAAQLTDTLASQGPFTVLAPTDEAFAALPEGALESLLANPDQLKAVLTLHVIAGRAEASDVVGLAEVETLQGSVLPIDATDGVEIGGAKVVAADVDAANGVIHVIDRVLLPQS